MMRDFAIGALSTRAMDACQLRIDNLTKPIYSLAQLEKIAARMAGIFNVEQPNHVKNGVIIFAGDTAVNGRQNLTGGKESLAVMKWLATGKSATHAVAAKLSAPVYLVDVGMEADTSSIDGIVTAKVKAGSDFFGMSPAMTAEETEAAIEVGAVWADRMHSEGIQVVAVGNVGERALLSALAVTAAVTEYPVRRLVVNNECTLTSDEKVERLTATLQRYSLSPEKPLQILASVGSPDIAALTGFILQAAAHRMAIVFDNAVTGAAVLLASLLRKGVTDYVFQSAAYDDPVHQGQMKYLGIKPYLFYHFTIEEGLGSAMGLSVVDASLHMLNDMKTFGEATVTVAEDGPGNKRQDGR